METINMLSLKCIEVFALCMSGRTYIEVLIQSWLKSMQE